MDIRKWHYKYSIDIQLVYNSEATRENYKSQVSCFLEHFKDEAEPKAIDNEKIKLWLLEAKTINSRKHRLCAINSFYKITVGMPSKIAKIPYPKAEKKLPIVLSQEEIQRMFTVCENTKHKVILSLLYSCGLRVSELINLKWANIDRSRMIINIIQAKGGKDRQQRESSISHSHTTISFTLRPNGARFGQMVKTSNSTEYTPNATLAAKLQSAITQEWAQCTW
jgi:integrase/recombinase XerD